MSTFITSLMREQSAKLTAVHGVPAQDMRLIEECAELSREIARNNSGCGSDNKWDTIGEVADVYNVLDQWVLNHNVEESDIIEVREKKMRRAMERAQEIESKGANA